MVIDEQKTVLNEEALKTAYGEVCHSYHLIDDFRARLLSLLPLVSGTGIFLLFSDNFIKSVNLSVKYLLVIGVFGFVITLGLLFYELRGVQRCIRLITVGEELEKLMGVRGQFARWPSPVGRFIKESTAASFIYSAILAAWTYVAMIASLPAAAGWVAGTVFLIGFMSTFGFYLAVEYPKGERW